jgi:pimeloyl-ACP methyl ester carboxylesterase
VATGGSLDVPVADAYGDHDIFGSAVGTVRARFPAAQQITFTGCGHMPWLPVPDQFEPPVRAFFAQPGQRR